MASIKQYNYSLDMAQSTVSEMSNVFPFNVEKGIQDATSITMQNINLAETYYQAVPAYFDSTNKRLYSSVTGADGYWTVSDNTLTYTAV